MLMKGISGKVFKGRCVVQVDLQDKVVCVNFNYLVFFNLFYFQKWLFDLFGKSYFKVYFIGNFLVEFQFQRLC